MKSIKIIENKASNEATIEINGIIGGGWFEDGTTKEDIKDTLKSISALKVKVINVEIDSFGGDVNHALAIYNMLSENKAEIRVKYTGWSASAATIIAASGSSISIPNNGMILVHEARGICRGTLNTLESYVDWIKKTNKILIDIFVKQTGKNEDEVKDVMAKDNGDGEWMTAEEAKDFGFVTNITESMAIAAYTNETFINNNIKIPKMSKEIEEKTFKDKVLNIINEALESSGLKKSDDKKIDELIENAVKTVEHESYEEKINGLEQENEALKGRDSKDVAEKDDLIQNQVSQLSAKDEELTSLKAEIETLKAEALKGNAKPVELKENGDPIINDDKKDSAGREFAENLSDHQKRNLSKNTN